MSIFRRKPARTEPASKVISAMLLTLAVIQTDLRKIMTSQSDIDAATAAITSLLADLQTQTASLVTDLTELQATIAAGQPVSTTALDSAVASAAAVQSALDTAVGNISTEAAPPASS